MMRGLMGFGLLLTLGGCHRGGEMRMEPQVGELGWRALAGVPVHVETDSFQLMSPGPSRGRFPATIAVARCQTNAGGRDSISLSSPGHLEIRRLNQALDHLLQVKSIFPIDERDLEESDASRESILASARTLGADLCLVYGPSISGSDSPVLRGTILEVSTGRPLAAIEAAAFEDSHIIDEKRGRVGYRRLGPQPFERCLARCVKALIEQDEPLETAVPAGWTPEGPVEPVIWPPYQREIRRPGGR